MYHIFLCCINRYIYSNKYSISRYIYSKKKGGQTSAFASQEELEKNNIKNPPKPKKVQAWRWGKHAHILAMLQI